MRYLRNVKTAALNILVIMVLVVVASCSTEDNEPPIWNRCTIQGKLNQHTIAINDINGDVRIDRSNFDFSTGNQTDIPKWFDWEVRLIETKDSIVTLYLHLDNVNLTNQIIYSPNDADPIKTKSTCYATLKDLKNKTTSLYHPTHPLPIVVIWRLFKIYVDENGNNPTKFYGHRTEYPGRRWTGMEGSLYGVLTSDDPSRSPLNIDFNFIVH